MLSQFTPFLAWHSILHCSIDVHFEHVKDILLWISHTGLVTWYTPAILKSSCKVQVRNFPFDVQYCAMTFASWSYDDTDLHIVYTNDSDASQNVFHSNGVWLLETVHVTPEKRYFACCKHPWSFLIYSFEMKRSPSFYISNIVIPCILLSLMTMMVFLLPPQSGEKIQLGMTNLLALILFQQLIAESMPPIGDETPIIGRYIAMANQVKIVSWFSELKHKTVVCEGFIWFFYYRAYICFFNWNIMMNWYPRLRIRACSNVSRRKGQKSEKRIE